LRERSTKKNKGDIQEKYGGGKERAGSNCRVARRGGNLAGGDEKGKRRGCRKKTTASKGRAQEMYGLKNLEKKVTQEEGRKRFRVNIALRQDSQSREKGEGRVNLKDWKAAKGGRKFWEGPRKLSRSKGWT